MIFDLDMVSDLCGELGLKCGRPSSDEAVLLLKTGVSLVFQNYPADDDCLIGFADTQWHAHDALVCADRQGKYIELSYLDIVSGLADGTVLICELWVHGALGDRWLVHRDYVDEFQYMQDGEEFRIRNVRGGTRA